MAASTWIELSAADISLVAEAVSAFRSATLDRADEMDRLVERLQTAGSPPAVTVGVYGGLVQWVQGNPYPIRIIDYDGDQDDLPDRDDEGLPCSLWHVDRDPDLVPAQG